MCEHRLALRLSVIPPFTTYFANMGGDKSNYLILCILHGIYAFNTFL